VKPPVEMEKHRKTAVYGATRAVVSVSVGAVQGRDRRGLTVRLERVGVRVRIGG